TNRSSRRRRRLGPCQARPSKVGDTQWTISLNASNNACVRTVPVVIELGYNPTVFVGLLERYGGVQTAKRLIAEGEIQYGFKRLAALGRLDLTMEFASLFTEGELAAARWRLDQLS